MLATTLAVMAMVTAQDGPVATAPPASPLDFEAYAREVQERNAAAQAEPGAGRIGFPVRSGPVPDDQPVPGWAFSDPARWERTQCGETPEDACLRTARNRLALARAEQAENAPLASGPAPGRCRNVWTPSAEGVGGSFSRICGDEAASAQLLEDMRRRDEQTRQDAERDCVRRPETTDQGVRWTLVCGSAANRERANEMLDNLLR